MGDQPFLLLFRGLPGSGKSTLAKTTGFPVVSADDFFTGSDGVYRFDPAFLPQAHDACQKATRKFLIGLPNGVAVANTFSQSWEIQPYAKIARETGARLVVVDLFDGGRPDADLADRNTHGVPQERIAQMRSQWEPNWAAADPRPPWER